MAGLREMRRFMTIGGTVALCFNRHSGQAKHGLVEMLVAAGFTDVQVDDKDGDFCALARKR